MIKPLNIPACGSCAKLAASGAPPISFASIEPANIAGSAPKALNTGVTIGPKTEASTGAKHITPTIAKARDPIAIIPSSNCSPIPNLFPRHLSIAPKAIHATII